MVVRRLKLKKKDTARKKRIAKWERDVPSGRSGGGGAFHCGNSQCNCSRPEKGAKKRAGTRVREKEGAGAFFPHEKRERGARLKKGEKGAEHLKGCSFHPVKRDPPGRMHGGRRGKKE